MRSFQAKFPMRLYMCICVSYVIAMTFYYTFGNPTETTTCNPYNYTLVFPLCVFFYVKALHVCKCVCITAPMGTGGIDR